MVLNDKVRALAKMGMGEEGGAMVLQTRVFVLNWHLDPKWANKLSLSQQINQKTKPSKQA